MMHVMSDFKFALPGSTTLALCLLLAIVLLTLVHVTSSYFNHLTAVSQEKKCLRADGEEVSERNFLQFLSASKAWDWRSWGGQPQVSLPVSLPVVEKQTNEAGMVDGKEAGIELGSSEDLVQFNWQRRVGPEFDAPPFPVYESQVPLSMAKIIMSRHSIRRPNLNRPRPTVQPPARRVHSMV